MTDDHTPAAAVAVPLDAPVRPWEKCKEHGFAQPRVWACPTCLVELREENQRLRMDLENTRAEAVLSEGLGLVKEMAEPYLHILTDDLSEMLRRETTAIVASVAFGTPDRGQSVPLVRHSTAEAYRIAAITAFERCAALCESWVEPAGRESGPVAAGWLHQMAQHMRNLKA